MGVRIIADRDRAALYCSTTGQAFGPTFDRTDDLDALDRAEAFLQWLAPTDARRLTAAELEAAFVAWLDGRASDAFQKEAR